MLIEEITVRELVEECLQTKGTAANERGVALEKDLDDPEAVLRGDRRLLRTAVNNMIEAAMGSSRPGGKVVVRHRRDPARETIVVSGGGRGIPYEELRGIYDLLCRPAMFAMDGEDEIVSGLANISIVKDIADLHGGRVGVRSFEGEGSTFTLHLPRRCAAPSG